MLRPGEAKRGLRVKHDDSGRKGVILSVFDRKGNGSGVMVEYATVRYDRTLDKAPHEQDHPTVVLSRA